MKTKFITLLLAVAASIGTMHAAIVNGTCGDNLTWSLNTKDSTLTIEGFGAMNNGDWNSSAPWNDYCSYIAYVSLPEGLINIGNFAFSGCGKISSITIPSSISAIGEYAFSGCNSLKSVHISDLAQWCAVNCGPWMSNPLQLAHNLYLNGDLVSDLIVPDGVISIGYQAFRECNLSSVTIPNSVVSIGGYAFLGCNRLMSVIIPNSVTNIGNGAFCDCSSLQYVIISNNVSRIESATFGGCTSLSSIEIPNSVTSIGGQNIDDGLGAFQGCSRLATVTIGSSITNIENCAFSGCNISKLTIGTTTPPIGGMNSGINNSSCKLYVPQEALATYFNALWWEDFASIRAIGSGFEVKFIDWDGTVLSAQEIENGSSATAPADPTRTGYTFIGWDKDFSNITEDLVVTAQYKINRYEVIFKDWDGTILKTDSVDYNTAATAPANPSREGHEFIGWDKDFSHVKSDMTVTAQYAVNYYPVGFLNYDGTLLSEQSIAYNQAAMAPSVPARDGYTFIGWTADIEHIKARTFAIALFEKQGLVLVTYKKEDGEIISSENVNLHLPEAPSITGKTFSGWLTESASNTEGVVFRATYTLDNPTTGEDVVVIPTSSTAGVSFPYITGAMTYMLVIRDLFGTVVCKIMFDADGHLLGIAFAPGHNRTQKAQSEGFHFTVEGLTPGTTYEYEFVAYDEADQVIETLTGSFETTADETGVNNISSASAPQKVINDGHVLILRGDKTYTMQGQEVK